MIDAFLFNWAWQFSVLSKIFSQCPYFSSMTKAWKIMSQKYDYSNLKFVTKIWPNRVSEILHNLLNPSIFSKLLWVPKYRWRYCPTFFPLRATSIVRIMYFHDRKPKVLFARLDKKQSYSQPNRRNNKDKWIFLLDKLI